MSKQVYSTASHDFPEVAQNQSGNWGQQAADPRGAAPEYYDQSHSPAVQDTGYGQSPQSAVGDGGGGGMGGMGDGLTKSESATGASAGAGHSKGPWRTPLALTLLAIIGLLSAAVIGLAAGTGIEASRASDARATVSALNARLATAGSATVTKTVTRSQATGSAATASPTGAAAFDLIDDGCSLDPDGTTGSKYTAFSLLGGSNFTRHCNQDTTPLPVMSLFVADFDSCMDACAGFIKYKAETDSASCGGVSFIPLWTDKSDANTGGAPGNCYLKAAPMNTTSLKSPDIGTECHAALVI